MIYPHRVRFLIAISLWLVLGVTFITAGCAQQEPAERGFCPSFYCVSETP